MLAKTKRTEQFDRDGFIVVKGGVDVARVEALRDALERMILARLRSEGMEPPAQGDLDAAFALLSTLGESYVGEIFRVTRETVELYELLFDHNVLEVVRELIPTAVLHVLPEAAALRADRKADAKRAFHWHYDYSYVTMSSNGITGWFPILPMRPELGYLRVVPGSHKSIAPVRFREEYSAAGNFLGHNVYELYNADYDELEKRSVDVPVDAGDVLFIHGCLLHRSGRNETANTRMTILGRYGDALDPALVARGWNTVRGRQAPRLFNELHPDLVHVE